MIILSKHFGLASPSPRILVRAISEGSTVVMKAISTNDEISMKKAMATSPRGKRAQEQCPWM